MPYTIHVNRAAHTVDVDGDTPLLWVLRDVFGMTGTKFGCGMALCGACTVHMDGNPIRSCITSIDSVGTSAITTIEAIGNTPAGRKIQKAWLDLESSSERCRYRRRDVRQHLPLRHLRPHPRSDQAGRAIQRQRTGRLNMLPDRNWAR